MLSGTGESMNTPAPRAQRRKLTGLEVALLSASAAGVGAIASAALVVSGLRDKENVKVIARDAPPAQADVYPPTELPDDPPTAERSSHFHIGEQQLNGKVGGKPVPTTTTTIENNSSVG